MKKMSTRALTLVTATAATAFLYFGPVNAQSQTPGGQQPATQQPATQQPGSQTPGSQQPATPPTSGAQASQSAQSSPLQGELLEVDTGKMIVAIRTSGGQREQFTYNNSTQVNNAAVAGLATMKNAQVTVHFTGTGSSRVATRIEVKPGSSTSQPSSTTQPGAGGAGSTPSRPPAPGAGSGTPGGSQQPQQPQQPR